MSTDWKDFAPCRNEDPTRFDVPTRDNPDGWVQLQETAETLCRTCPFMQRQCATDLNGRHGLWAGSVRWDSARGLKWRVLLPEAPVPSLPNRGPLSTAEWIGPRRVAS